MKTVLKIAFAYLAAVIGAGFASGSEITYYFVRYGRISCLGILLSSAGFGFFAYLVTSRCHAHSVTDFPGLVSALFPPVLQKYIHIVITLFMAVVLGGMISAFSILASETTGADCGTVGILFTLICGIILLFPEKTVISRTGFLGTIIVIAILYVCIYMLNNRSINVFSNNMKMTASAVSYTSYNVTSVCPMLCSAASELKTKRSCIYTGLVSFLLTFMASGLIWCVLSVYYGKIPLGELPMLTLALRQGKVFYFFYSFVISIAILTSAVANGFGLVEEIKNLFLPLPLKVMAVVFTGYFISSAGFTFIVNKFYNAAGILSSVLAICLIIDFSKKGEF